MFNQQKRVGTGQSKKDQVRDYAVTIITDGCHFSGKLFCKGSTRIGGKVDGEIVSEGLLIIEEDACITAEVKAEDIVIQGYFKGVVEATGKVEMSGTCVFEGDVATPVLVVLEGAQFNGRTTMDASKISERNARHQSTQSIVGGPTLVAGVSPSELESSQESEKVPEINANM